MIAVVLALVFGGGGLAAGGAGAGADVDAAERAYRAGRFAEALALFADVLSEDAASADPVSGPHARHGAILYNMGNCAYRLERHAEAVLHYRRALLRLPRDPQVRFNLRLAEREVRSTTPWREPFGAPIVAWVDALPRSWLLALAAALQGAGLVGLVLVRRGRLAAAAARAGLWLVLFAGLAVAARLVHARWSASPPAGVVLAPEIALRSEPHRDLPVVLALRSGETVCVAELSDRWMRVAHLRGGGWTERRGVGVVD